MYRFRSYFFLGNLKHLLLLKSMVMKILILFFFMFSIEQLSIAQQENAVDFDGVDDFINCGNDASINFQGNSLPNITYEAWIFPTAYPSAGNFSYIINNDNSLDTPTINTDNGGYSMRLNSNGLIQCVVGTAVPGSTTALVIFPNSSAIPLNTWTHVAIVFGTVFGTPNIGVIYINGVLDFGSVNTIPALLSSPTNLTIGSYHDGSHNFKGKIDEVRIWEINRSQALISEFMTKELWCGDTLGLRAYYQFNQGVNGGANSTVITAIDELGTNTGSLQNISLNGSTSNWKDGVTLTLCPVLLPVSLVHFEVSCLEDKVELNWKTLSELNNDYFTIEKSLDGINYKFVTTLKGAGNSSHSISYSWSDRSQVNSTIYYRLSQTDYNGEMTFIDDKTVSCRQDKTSVYPNPFKQSLHINSQKNGTYSLYNSYGEIVLQGRIVVGKNRIVVSSLEIGLYFVRIELENNEIKIKKLLKIN